MSNWTLFSNHGHVLVCLARDPQARLRDVAASVGITERAVQKIVRDLQHGGMISVSKQGRRNQYRIHRKVALRHPLESESRIGGLLDLVNGGDKSVAVAKPEVTIKATVANPVIQKPVIEESGIQKPVVQRSVVHKPVEQPKSSKSVDSQSDAVPAAAKSTQEKKSPEKTKPKSDIEKQQGSLF